MGRTNIKIVRFYEGSKSARELMNKIVAYKVRKRPRVSLTESTAKSIMKSGSYLMIRRRWKCYFQNRWQEPIGLQ